MRRTRPLLAAGSALLAGVALVATSASADTPRPHPTPASTTSVSSSVRDGAGMTVGSVDIDAVAFVQGVTPAQALASVLASHGTAIAPLTSSGTAADGKTYQMVGSSAMAIVPGSSGAVVTHPGVKGQERGHVGVTWHETSATVKATSLPDPVADYMAAYGETRAQALAYFGGDPLATSGAVLADGTRLAPSSGAAKPATVAGSGPIIQSGCTLDPPASTYYHYHACFFSTLDQGSWSGGGAWYVSENFKETYSVDGWWRYPTYADLWMDHKPMAGNNIVDWSPAHSQQSGIGCGTASIGLTLGMFSHGVSWEICDGVIEPDGPLVYTPGRGIPAGWTFGPKWSQNGYAVSGRQYELQGVSLVQTTYPGYSGKTFQNYLTWAG